MLLHQDDRPCLAEGPLDEARSQGGDGGVPIFCDDHALAGGKPVGLDHVQRRQLVQVLDGLVHIGERPGTPGGDPILVAQLFCPRLRSLDPGRSPGGAERPVPFGIQLVHQAVHERRLRAHHREVDGFPLDQFEDAAHVVRIHGNAGGIHGDPGIAWCGEHPVDRRVLGQAPHDGVLPPSPTDDEDPHATARLCSRAGPTETTPIRTPTRSWRRSTYLRAAGGRLPNERASDSDSSHPSNSSYTGCARWNTDWCEGMSSNVSPSATYPVHTLIARNPESTSSLVRKISDRPFSRAAYRTRTASTTQSVSSSTIMAFVPSSDPAAWTSSNPICTSRWSAVRKGVDEPPGVKAFSRLPSRIPPAYSSMSSRAVVPMGAS